MRIINFGQVVDLEWGGVSLANQLTVELDDGRRATITTDDKTVQRLLDLAAGIVKKPLQASDPFASGTEVKHFEPGEEQYRQEPAQTADDAELAAIYGGAEEPDPGEIKEPDLGRMAESKLTPAPTVGGLGSGNPAPVRKPVVDKDGFALPIPSRTVEMDEMGYPVVARSGKQLPPDDSADDGTQI